MKLGILTFHSQLNYGGVLQCWALKTALEKMGHEVVVIDREFEHQIRSVLAVFRGWGVRGFIKWVIKLVLGRKEAFRIVRYVRTVFFAKRYLNLTSYSFKGWRDAPANLGVDLIVVGSDQVWNGIWQDPGPYLLEGAPNVRAIGYAISLGMKEMPKTYMEKYRTAATRFAAVSVREKECIGLLRTAGIESRHVSDPVLLADWRCLRKGRRVGVFCYFIGNEGVSNAAIHTLEDYSRTHRVEVSIYVHGVAAQQAISSRIVKVCYCAGPLEFVRGIASAEVVISDSFHALMFSSVFDKNVRIVRPQKDNLARKVMFARMAEFAAEYVRGDCFVDSVDEALTDLSNCPRVEYDYEAIGRFVEGSRQWLREACER